MSVLQRKKLLQVYSYQVALYLIRYSSALSTFGALLGQPMPLQPRTSISIAVAVLCGMSMFINNMYKSVLISKLTATVSPDPIDSLDDLIGRPDIRIYLANDSYQSIGFLSLETTRENLLDRIDLYNRPPEESLEMLESIFSGSHVLIGNSFTLKAHVYRTLGRHAACEYPYDGLHMSRDVLFTSYFSYGYRKGFEHAETVNVNVLRQDQGKLILDDKEGIFTKRKLPGSCPRGPAVRDATELVMPPCKDS